MNFFAQFILCLKCKFLYLKAHENNLTTNSNEFKCVLSAHNLQGTTKDGLMMLHWNTRRKEFSQLVLSMDETFRYRNLPGVTVNYTGRRKEIEDGSVSKLGSHVNYITNNTVFFFVGALTTTGWYFLLFTDVNTNSKYQLISSYLPMERTASSSLRR